MGKFQRRYTDEQRDAVRQAWGDRGIRPASRIVQLAAEGELTCDGELVPAFELTLASARSIGATYVRRIERQARAAIAVGPPRDAVEQLRRRIVAALDAQLTDVERRQARKKHASVKASELQGLVRALRELSALPGASGEPATGKPPGSNVGGKTDGGKTRGGLAAQLLATVEPRPITAADETDAGERINAPAPGDAHERESDSGAMVEGSADDDGERDAAQPASERINVGDTDSPGEYARAGIARLAPSRPA